MEKETINKGDPFFEWEMGSRWNACVGLDDSDGYYANGYIAAARLLSNTLLEKDNGMNDMVLSDKATPISKCHDHINL